jgi:hypothetical protein
MLVLLHTDIPIITEQKDTKHKYPITWMRILSCVLLTRDGFGIGRLDLLTPYTLISELHVTTALSFFLHYRSLHAVFSVGFHSSYSGNG